jgi:ribosomal protein L11
MAYTPPPNSQIGIPDQTDSAMIVSSRPQTLDRISFAKVVAGGVDTSWGSVIKTGSGMTINQTSGNLLITTGTTVNSETIIRSTKTYSGGIRLREQTVLSQRIANNSFFVELVDVIGDGLSITISSATVAVVTIPSNPFDASNVGQSTYLGNYTGTGTFIPGRYVIASVSGNNVTYTVAGFAAGSGTASVFGWNYYHILYDSTTATSTKFDTQRKGYNTGDTVATINTTASPGHVGIITGNDSQAVFSDQLVASSAAARNTVRASRDLNIPDDMNLYIQVRAVNGSTAPATTTTWTMGALSISNYALQDVVIQDLRQTTNNTPLPVEIQRAITLTTSTTVNATTTPVTPTVLNLNTAATTNGTSFKASAGSLTEISVSNVTATPIFVKLYNKASAPTVGTDVPIFTISAAANTTVAYEFGFTGKRFSAGIALAATGAIGASDTTSAVAGVQISGSYI